MQYNTSRPHLLDEIANFYLEEDPMSKLHYPILQIPDIARTDQITPAPLENQG